MKRIRFLFGVLCATVTFLSQAMDIEERKEVIGNFFDSLVQDQIIKEDTLERVNSIKLLFQNNANDLFGTLEDNKFKTLFTGLRDTEGVYRYFKAVCQNILIKNQLYTNYKNYLVEDYTKNLRSYFSSGKICNIFYTYFSPMVEKYGKILKISLRDRDDCEIVNFIPSVLISLLQSSRSCWNNALSKYKDNGNVLMLLSWGALQGYIESYINQDKKNSLPSLSTSEYYLESACRVFLEWVSRVDILEKNKGGYIESYLQAIAHVFLSYEDYKQREAIYDEIMFTLISRIAVNVEKNPWRRFGESLVTKKNLAGAVVLVGSVYLFLKNRHWFSRAQRGDYFKLLLLESLLEALKDSPLSTKHRPLPQSHQ